MWLGMAILKDGDFQPHPTGPLLSRYHPEDLGVFTSGEAEHFLGAIDPCLLERVESDAKAWEVVAPKVAWELLYRLEPDLYERLIAGEWLHPGILQWLPGRVDAAVEVGAGAGRLTMTLAPRCGQLFALEPARPLAQRLKGKLRNAGHNQVRVVNGFCDSIPVTDGYADLVIACSAFTSDPAHGGERGLAEMERVCATGGLVVIVWPEETCWLADHGFRTVTFEGSMSVHYASRHEAEELAEIFYPEAFGRIVERGKADIPYDLLGVQPPRALSFKRKTGLR
jgi:SAM-dependent methyltransferase